MPRELIATGPGKAELRHYEEAPLGARDVRIKCEFASPKHGTESHNFKSDALTKATTFDAEYRAFVPLDDPRPVFPRKLGNMSLGTITEIGPQVTRFKPGDRVYGHMAVRETYTVHELGAGQGATPLGSGARESRLHKLPDDMRPEQVMLLDPGHFALAAVRDANVRVGERVAVFGLGAIGLLIVQLCRLCGAELVVAVDPLANRRKLAETFGADLTFDPTACDAGLEIKKVTGKKGVDVAIDASGSYHAMQAAMRCVHYSGMLVTCSYYKGAGTPLHLDQEFFLARITIRASMPVWGNPCRDYPMWDDERIEDTIFRLIRDGKVNPEGLIDPICAFDASAQAYELMSEHPDRGVKLGIRF
jgi:2-desacetyl-2-hydroxyethyl bacteriochlorophyllide A dehydrogenase